MSEQKETTSSEVNTSEWKEYDDFYAAHELQLFGMSFPKELGEKLYFKLKNEIFDTNMFFEILDNQDECRYLLKAKKDIKKNEHVFLVDHAWTYRLRQYSQFCENYPQIIKRATTMLKYGHVKKDIISLQAQQSQGVEKKKIDIYNAELAAKSGVKELDYDDYELTNDTFDKIMVNELTETLTMENNKIDNIQLLYDLLDKFNNIKGLWVRDNSFCDVNPQYEEYIMEHYPNIQLLNRKLTPNAGKWAIEYLLTDKSEKKQWEAKYNEYYGHNVVLDLSARYPLVMKSFDGFKEFEQVTCIDLTDNEYTFEEGKKEECDLLIKLLQSFGKNLEKIIVDDNDDIFDMNDESGENVIDSIFTNTALLNEIKTKVPNVKYINDFSIDNILSHNSTKSKLIQLKREFWVHKYMWTINRTYRLITSEKFDEEPIWYINDEFGSALNHSDVPNCAMFPIIYSKSNKFEKDELITYSIMWPIKDVKKGDEIYIDFLANIGENEERSARLTTWFNTPKEYFLGKFNEKMNKYAQKNLYQTVMTYKTGVEVLIKMDENKEEITDEHIKQIFDFTLCGKDDKLIKETIEKIRKAIHSHNTKSNNIFTTEFKDKKIKVATDLPYVKANLNLPNFEFTNSLNDADIIWLNANLFTFVDANKITLKPHTHLNQYPYESIITMKSHLTDLIQTNAGINGLINLSYDMQTELAEIIGNYYYNQEHNLDNSWILKPINMSRSMDMTITNNLTQIIRSVETGPKICQKYIERPFVMNEKKFDLRFIILVKKLVPLELYFYSKMFWIRSANKPFSMDSSTFDDYEVHFTVMNYNTFGMQTIYNTDFINYLKEHNIDWDIIYKKLKKQLEVVFLLAGKDCPQMINENSGAIYGLDAMIDADLEPKIIEINFQPDCTRACKFVPEFYNDLFSTLFLDKPSGVELV